MESSKVDNEESHSGKGHGSIKDVHISALQRIKFTGELKLQYFVATAGPNNNLSFVSEPSDYFRLTVKANF